MAVQVEQVSPHRLADYARVPIAFEVRSVLALEPIDGGLGGIRLRERAVERPYVKDYDGYEGERPTQWPERFDLRNWAIFLAGLDRGDADALAAPARPPGDVPPPGTAVGGATVAFDTPGVDMLEGRRDLAVLWDIRVDPAVRRRGIGAALFARAAEWARGRGATLLKVETQNVNVAACRFYAAQGCTLGAIDRRGYAAHPHVADETMLLWCLEL